MSNNGNNRPTLPMSKSDYSKSSANQRGSTVSGGQAGRDLIRNETYYNAPLSTITNLYNQLDSESSGDQVIQSKVDDLEYFLTEAEYSVGRTLAEKLKDGGRESDIRLATIQKERASKKLHRHSTKLSAQKIYAFILSKIHSDFRTYITPLIEQNYDKAVIEERISEKVIEPTIGYLESNKLELTYDDIRGLIYLLTGNCHIEWTVYADLSSDI